MTGELEYEIPGVGLVSTQEGTSLSVSSASPGTYSLQLESLYEEDSWINLVADEEAGSVSLHGFFPGVSALDFEFNPASTTPISVLHEPARPAGLIASFDRGSTRLSWSASPSPDVVSYKVYSRRVDERRLTLLAEPPDLFLDTGHPWASEEHVARVYAVSAVDNQGRESLLAVQALNNDRDHDGVSDVAELARGWLIDNADSDDEGLLDGEELANGTDGLLPDTDGDGFTDLEEVETGSNPLDPATTPFELTVALVGQGSGQVVSQPVGIDCLPECSDLFGPSEFVVLAATEDPGSDFAGWGGDCDASGQVVMDADKSCDALFDLNSHTLTVTKEGTGGGAVTSAPAGIDCGSTCIADFDSGTAVDLMPLADVGSQFVGWSGDCDASGQVVMDAGKICTATFELDTHDLVVDKEGSGGGTVSSTPGGIDCGSTCSSAFDFGTQVQLLATSDPGSQFVNWGADCDAAGQVLMDASKLCSATFALDSHTLTVVKEGTGAGTVTSMPPGIVCGSVCSADYDFSTNVALLAQPDPGSEFRDWGETAMPRGRCSWTARRNALRPSSSR